MNYLKKTDNALTLFEQYSIFILLLAMTLLIFWGVVNRFILQHSLKWCEELARYIGIWAVLISASLGVKRGIHVGVEAFVMVLPKKVQKYVSLLTTLLSLMFSIAVTYVGFEYALRLVETNQLSPAMRMPIVWAYLSVPIGCLLMSCRYVLIFLTDLLGILSSKSAAEGGGSC